MFLDIKVSDKILGIEFKTEEIRELSDYSREWHMVSNGDSKEQLKLSFKDEGFTFSEITQKPQGLKTEGETLIDLINEFLRQEFEKHQSGIDISDEGHSDEEMQPYDPKKISIRSERWSLPHVYSLIKDYGDIELNPDFQRNFVWDRRRRSRLIESLMLRIPIPAFYLSETGKGKYQVVDGLQRLTTITDFLSNRFVLKNLEYLIEQEGRCFENSQDYKGIDSEFLKAIKLTQLNVNIIEASSPSKVKFDVFRRVNTGGKPLNNQEIRNCLAEKKTRELINILANSEEFKKATDNSVRTTRMQAQELVLRFIAFYHFYEKGSASWEYRGNMTEYLDQSIVLLNSGNSLNQEIVIHDFINSMKNCYHLFGEFAFRKCLPEHLKKGARRQLINKSLFTTWSVLLSKIDHNLIKSNFKRKKLIHPLANELKLDEDYYDAISYRTNDRAPLSLAFQTTQKLIEENLK